MHSLLLLLFAGPVTYHPEVERLIAARCQICHREGEAGPMPLTTYKEVRPWAKAIKEAVLSRRMPPWHADPEVGHFRNDLSLTKDEIETIRAWVDGGAPQGDPAVAAPPPQFTTGWRITRPDVVFEIPGSFEVPKSGVLDYQYFEVATQFREDKWVEMAEVRPGERSVVHHAIVTVREPGDSDWYGGQFLAGYAPGAAPQVWKAGQARLVRAGSTLVFQMHYTANGKVLSDRTRIGLVFAKQPPRQRIYAGRATSFQLRIPPGEANYKTEAAFHVPEASWLAAVRPHMHYRGKSFEVRAVFPNGETRTVLRVPKYSFLWQPYYYLETPLRLPAGTRLECTAVFDNSANNPFNPDPSAWVSFGEQTWQEMMIGWFDLAVDLPAAAARASGGR